MRLKRSWLRCGLGLALVGLALWLLVSYLTAYQLTRRPHAWFAEPAPAIDWGEVQAHKLKTRDGHELGAWLIPGAEDGPSVLLLHGNGGSRRKCLDRAEILASEGCSVLLVSLRAHGDSSGEFNDIGYSARHDVVAAVEFLERRRPGRRVLIHGTSMGAAAAVFAAAKLGHRASGYVLECLYKDLKTAVGNRTENALPPVLDGVAYRGLLLVSPLVLPELAKISPLEAIAGIPEDVPVLTLAGGIDRRARPEESRALFDRVKSHGTLAIFDGADHVQLHVADPGRYRRLLADFLRTAGRRSL